MKNAILNYSISTMKKQNKYDDEQLAIIRYGLESIYILITKTVVIFTVAAFFNIFKEVLLFSIFYNFIRMPSFGLHATKSWMCYVASAFMFIFTPFICTIWESSMMIRALIGAIAIIFIFKNSPADTKKRPIISKRRRENFKLISTLIAIIMIFTSLFVKNTFIHNSLLLTVVMQCFMISPLIYKIFKLPYNNYKAYQNVN